MNTALKLRDDEAAADEAEEEAAAVEWPAGPRAAGVDEAVQQSYGQQLQEQENH